MQFAQYEHRQTSWAPTLLAAVLLAVFVAALIAGAPLSERLVAWVIALALIALAVFAMLLCCMTIRIIDGQLHWSYGRFEWPRWSLSLEQIAATEATRTRLVDGWGVHRTKRGWLYNLAGFDAVLIRRADDVSFLLGTDEPQQLALALDLARSATRARGRQRRAKAR